MQRELQAWNKKSGNGFTMFEILVVMGIFLLVGGLALFVGMETYRSSNFHSDRDLLVAVLQHTRAQATNNVCVGTCTDGMPHGVHIQSDAYVAFQGSVYNSSDSNNAAFDSSITTKNPTTLDIVFSQLSGAASPTSITLTDTAGHSSMISVGSEGQITWTN